jgi:DNA-binding MarR family transcriptional regulator
METITLTSSQKETLKQIISRGKTIKSTVDSRSVNALENRGLVKVSETRKGVFVTVTAKGKKLN